MNIRALTTVLFASVALPGLVQAQVYRCTDGGRTSYSHIPCASGATRVVNTRPNTIDRSSEREHHQRLIRQGEEREVEQQRYARPAVSAGRIDQMACNNARRDVDAAVSSMQTEMSRGKRADRHRNGIEAAQIKADAACGTTTASRVPRDKPKYAERNSPALGTPPPSVMTHCAGGFCYDNQGGVYHQHGGGTTMTGPNGRTCIRTGATVQCP